MENRVLELKVCKDWSREKMLNVLLVDEIEMEPKVYVKGDEEAASESVRAEKTLKVLLPSIWTGWVILSS